jgi:hypothetical protein
MILLLLIFTTIPDGVTADQIAFALLNILGQVNVLVSRQLNARCLLSELELADKIHVDSCTAVYAMLLRRFADAGNGAWDESAGLLPQTNVWREWREKVVHDRQADPKALYNEIASRTK